MTPIDLGQLFDVEEAMTSTPVLPEPDELNFYKLYNDRKLYLDFDVGDAVLTIHKMILLWNMEDKALPVEERKPIRIYFMSYGGDSDYMWMLTDTILLSKTPVYTINVGMAGSAAAIIFLAGHKRIMMPQSVLIIHEGSAQMAGDSTKVLDASAQYKKDLAKMKEYILSRTAIPKPLLMKKRNNDWTIDATFCLNNDVCHQIAETLDDIL